MNLFAATLLFSLAAVVSEELPRGGADDAGDRRATVEVQTRAGRTLTGVVDDRTDDRRLWLRRDEDGIALATSVAWDDVAVARVDGAPQAIGELVERAGNLASAPPAWYGEVVHSERPYHTLVAGSAVPVAGRGAHRVRSVEIVAACLANFDHDVEPDGLRISLAALDHHGIPVAVRGSLSVQLVGERRPAHAPNRTFGMLDRWTQPVRTVDFIDGAATYELPFRQTAPEWEFELTPDALVSVTLGVYGEGNFAASAPVVVREFNPLRDRLQLEHGTRFVPHEPHRRHPHSLPRSRDAQWLYWLP